MRFIRRQNLRTVATATAATMAVAALATLITPAAAAAPKAANPKASADTMVFLKNGQVWEANADGTHAHVFLKSRNDWGSPSIDNAGRLVVLGGKPHTNPDGTEDSGSAEIYRFTAAGKRIGKPIPTWGSYSTGACPTYGPYTARVSPDGKKVAYGIFQCGDGSSTTLWTPTTSKGLNFPNQSLGQGDFIDPQWQSNNQFVVSHVGPQIEGAAQWFIHPTSGKDYAGTGWAEPALSDYQVHALISRDGDEMAVFAEDGYNYVDGHPRHLLLYLYTRPAGTGSGWKFNWDKRCTVSLPARHLKDPTHLSPSFSTDGSKLYWGDASGVESAPFTSTCANVTPHLVIAGGAQPYVG